MKFQICHFNFSVPVFSFVTFVVKAVALGVDFSCNLSPVTYSLIFLRVSVSPWLRFCHLQRIDFRQDARSLGLHAAAHGLKIRF